MANDRSSIEWTDATWSPVTGCTKVSEGCRHCYAETMAKRFWGDRHFGDVQCHPDRLEQPLRWRKPRRVFVCSMADLFHPAVPDDFLDQVFAVMALAPRHTFQVLTKRPERMLNYLRDRDTTQLLLAADDTRATGCRQPWTRLSRYACVMLESQARGGCLEVPEWPLPNVWLGVSAEDQATADERIPVLLDTPSALCFVSAEPLLGPVAQLWQYLTRKFFSSPGARELLLNGKAGQKSAPHSELDWVIVGGESGPGARPCEVRWIRSIVEQCRDYDVPCFVKQLGAKPVARDRYDMSEEFFRRADASEEGYGDETVVLRLRDRKGGDPDEWPEDLRVRQWPDPPPP